MNAVEIYRRTSIGVTPRRFASGHLVCRRGSMGVSVSASEWLNAYVENLFYRVSHDQKRIYYIEY